MNLVSHAALAELHPTFGHPESTDRLRVLIEAFPDAREAAPATEESYLDDVHTTYDGRALAVVRPTGSGTITVTATADGGDAVSVTVDAR